MPLVRHMMDLEGGAQAFRRVPPEEIDCLQRHDWPGNVRELRNLVTIALAYNRGRPGPVNLSSHLNRVSLVRKPAGGALVDSRFKDSKMRHDREYFAALYEATDGNLTEIARRAELNRETVRIYLRTLRIEDYRKSGK